MYNVYTIIDPKTNNKSDFYIPVCKKILFKSGYMILELTLHPAILEKKQHILVWLKSLVINCEFDNMNGVT